MTTFNESAGRTYTERCADVPSDIEISRNASPGPIMEIAAKLGLKSENLKLYGDHIAKVRNFTELMKSESMGHLILVSAITPTPAGEGKTTISIGLAQGLAKIGEKVCLALREPSLGPSFGVKGGATGGGRSQVLPMEDINLHFTGDIHAVSTAHNLLAAALDNHLHHGNALRVNPADILLRRVIDLNDRSLRNIVIGLGGKSNAPARETGFDISVASEIMAILCLSRDREDLETRLAKIIVGFTYDGEPVTASDLRAVGSMSLLLRDALMPNLVQTIEGVPAFIHGGPFANIAQGTNSIIATRSALGLADFVVTEAGFGFDLGAEKFMDIKCRTAGIAPSAAVLVATVRALKHHGGVKLRTLSQPDPEAVRRGLENLDKHLENMNKFNICPVVAINRFPGDTDEEIEIIIERCRAHSCSLSGEGVGVAVVTAWADGGEGAARLAEIVAATARNCSREMRYLYDPEKGIEASIETISKEIYGANAVDYTPQARKDLRAIKKLGLDKLPVCIAKTQKSLSDNPALLGRPKDFIVTVREIQIAAGAGFLIPITGEIMRMPGLPSEPALNTIGFDENGNVVNLF
ncbi:MAG: formate--tetrahydrofolate ligase [Candidatus Wallbacteria bacterium HGW-Wallbacteria-1]|uniref:Formate--tetrahydrofolate ligase n=1 Tax=Candidatus Wallbacteria bacterium HGW-Wallbacteria-1 TaxID=2013854 RepID=A0A2N1PMP5_9BACT|nr:MAG: formate--tetrahydrofolate ligase [Candidatus Wallbacteria bacterium HGW-Wallbacteria-1]